VTVGEAEELVVGDAVGAPVVTDVGTPEDEAEGEALIDDVGDVV